MSEAWADAVNLDDLERLAAGRLDAGTLGYYAGGAGDERTLRANTDAWAKIPLRPRVAVDVSQVSSATTVLGCEIAFPALVAPTALHGLAHPDAEPGMARAAAAAGTIMCVSTLATTGPADVAAAAPGAPRWFQLYVFRDAGVTRALLDEALGAGYEAVVLTLDAPRAGKRERDARTRFAVPASVGMPAVRAAMGDAHATPTPVGFFSLLDTTLTWQTVERLAADLPVPLVVKGIQTAEDAALAVEHGAAAVIVSNHGGRQLDGVAATAELLPECVAAVAGRAEVLVDGGVRRGTDVLRALALGAQAVLLGRPLLWGLTLGGEAGARHALQLIRAEVELALTLLGCPTPADVTAAHVGPPVPR